jgi:hypothetical protein
MLYVFNLQIKQTTKEPRTCQVDISGSMQDVIVHDRYTNMYQQTKIVDAADETEAHSKIQTHYTSQNTDLITYNIDILSVSDMII